MKRALISVYDKEGIVEFAFELKKLGWEIISTGGTSKTLQNAGIEIIEVEDVTKNILSKHMKTFEEQAK